MGKAEKVSMTLELFLKFILCNIPLRDKKTLGHYLPANRKLGSNFIVADIL